MSEPKRDLGMGHGAPIIADTGDMADEAEAFVATLDDQERGRLASALIDASGDATGRLTELRLDSTDPSLMSRADLATLLADTFVRDRRAVERAFAAMGETTEAIGTLGAIFAPSRGSSDTSTLGGDPTEEGDDPNGASPR